MHCRQLGPPDDRRLGVWIVSLEQPKLERGHQRLSAISGSQLLVQLADVRLGCGLADVELAANLRNTEPVGQ